MHCMATLTCLPLERNPLTHRYLWQQVLWVGVEPSHSVANTWACMMLGLGGSLEVWTGKETHSSVKHGVWAGGKFVMNNIYSKYVYMQIFCIEGH